MLDHESPYSCESVRPNESFVQPWSLHPTLHLPAPTRAFTPELIHTYEALRAAGQAFEVVFVSLDKDEAAFEEYYAEMPWLAVPFGAGELRSKLQVVAKVEGIPTLVILDKDMQVGFPGRGLVAGANSLLGTCLLFGAFWVVTKQRMVARGGGQPVGLHRAMQGSVNWPGAVHLGVW